VIEDYAKIPDRLRTIAGRLVGDSRKELLAIANLIEQSSDLLKPSYSRTFTRRRNRAAKTKLPIPVSSVGDGIGVIAANENRSNEERQEESIALVSEAVAVLRSSHDWESLGAREKIKLLQIETLKVRGAKISSQTLYQPWIRSLWQC
jgi:hypothetical protein